MHAKMRGLKPQLVETEMLRVYQRATRKANQLVSEALISEDFELKALSQLNSIYFLALQKSVVPVLTRGKLTIDQKVAAIQNKIA